MSDTTEARLAALENAVADLQRELAEARKPQMRSMRATHRCPSCGGRRLLHVREIKDVAHGAVHSLSLQKALSKWLGNVEGDAGVLEAIACRACRLVEWHARSLNGVTPDGTTVLEIVGAADDDGGGDGAPYR